MRPLKSEVTVSFRRFLRQRVPVYPLLVLFAFFCIRTVVVAQDGVSASVISEIRKAWEERLSGIHGVRIAWTEHHTDALTERWSMLERRGLPAPEGLEDGPPDKYKMQVEASISGALMRYRRHGRRPQGIDNVQNDYTATFDGHSNRMFFPVVENGVLDIPTGRIDSEQKSCDQFVSVSITAPIRWLVAPLQPEVANYDVSKFHVLPGTVEIDGRNCIAVEVAGSTWPQTYWLDPERHYSIVKLRILRDRDESLFLETKVDYELTAAGFWFPVNWTEKRPKSTTRVLVEDYDINPHFRADEFTLEFPPGTRVSGDTEGKQQ